MADSDKEPKQQNCRNCGAIISVDVHKCPYCGGFSYEGAKKKYFKDLNNIKDNLVQLEEVPVESYKKEASIQIKKIIKTAIICLVIVAIFYGARILSSKLEDWKYSFNLADAKDQLLWEHENLPILDEWYEAGEYDKLVDFCNDLYSKDIIYSINNWKHDDFIWIYEGVDYAKMVMKRIEQNEKCSLYDITSAIDSGLTICYHLGKKDLDEDEIARLELYKPDMNTLLFDMLKFSEEEALQLYEDASVYSFLDHDIIKKYAADVIKRLDRD